VIPRFIWEPLLVAVAVIGIGFVLKTLGAVSSVDLFVVNAFIVAGIRCWAIRTGFDMRNYNRDNNG
jgi:threonine/homoserine efflux transporter RhtA